MRLSVRWIIVPSFAMSIVGATLAQAAPTTAASGPDAKVASCPAESVDELNRRPVYQAYKTLVVTDVESALRKAYLNALFTQWHLETMNKVKCESQRDADAAKKEALADYRDKANNQAVTQKAVAAIDRARLMSSMQSLAEGANDNAVEQFLLLRSAAFDPKRAEEASKLAALVPTYPVPTPLGDVDADKVLGDVAKAQETAAKAQSVAKDIQALSDAASKSALVMKGGAAGAPDEQTRSEARAAAARNALSTGQDAVSAIRLAKDAQGAGDAAVNLALRALGKTNNDLAQQDLASAQGVQAQLKFDKERLDYVRTDALLKKLGIQASQETTLSVAQQREYVTYLSVVANNPDAQALLGSSGVKLTANSGQSNATLKLSVEKVLGLEQRLFDVTVTAPTTKDRTFIDNSIDGLAGGITLQVTGSKYYLLPDAKLSHFGIVGAGAKIGHETHTYVDVTDFSETKDITKTPSSYFLYAGYAPVTMKSLLLGKFEYQNAFKDAKSATQCPVQASGPVTCQSGPIGGPSQIHKRIWSLEWRQAWDSVAIGASLSRDTVGRQTKLDIPIYFLNGSDGKGGTPLTGGIDLSWDTKNHAMFGLFIGTPFTVLDY